MESALGLKQPFATRYLNSRSWPKAELPGQDVRFALVGQRLFHAGISNRYAITKIGNWTLP